MMINESWIAVSRMQKYFKLIRLAAGLSMDELATRMGVTRLTISNIERGVYPLSKPYYLALRLIYFTIAERSLDGRLKRLISSFIDDELFPENVKEFISGRVERETKTAKGRIGRLKNVEVIFDIVDEEKHVYFDKFQVPYTTIAEGRAAL